LVERIGKALKEENGEFPITLNNSWVMALANQVKMELKPWKEGKETHHLGSNSSNPNPF